MARAGRRKITAEVISSLKPGQIVMDRDQPGFGVRRQQDAVVFFVRKHARGQRHFETIGEHAVGGLTVSLARGRATRLIMAIQDGKSPAERRAFERGLPTVHELAEQWLDLHGPKLKPKTVAEYRSLLKVHILPKLGRVRVDQMDEAIIARMHHACRETPYSGNRSLAVLSKMLNFAEQQGYRQKNTNPVVGIQRYREEQRERFLSSDELAALGRALSSKEVAQKHSPFALAAIGFLLLTGMRLREVLHLKWSEVDLSRSILLLSDSKTGAKPVILGAHAIELLQSLPRQHESPWVFPSGLNHSKPMYDLKTTWKTVSRVAGLEGVRIHDLRHSFASVAASSGGSLPMIGKLLGHSQAQTTARYAHFARDPVRGLADKASASIASSMGLTVVPKIDR